MERSSHPYAIRVYSGKARIDHIKLPSGKEYHLYSIPYYLLSTDCCPKRNPFKRSLKRFLVTNLSEAEDQRFKGVRSKGMFLNRLERALDLSKNGLEKRKGIWATAC